MTSLGFSEYAETGNNNNEPKNNIRRNGGGGGGVGGVRQNRTLKIPRNQEVGPVNSNETPPSGRKIKQIKDYIENIHRKGGEDSDEDPDDTSLLPSYPAQGMGVYATNVSHSGVIRGAETVSSNTPQVVRKTTQMNSLNPGSSYSTTLLEGMDTAARTASATHDANSSPYFEKLTGISGAPKKDAVAAAAAANATKTAPFSTNAYASRYYEQFVPYAETLANQLASSSGGVSGTNAALIEKLNYIIHMLEEKKDEKTGHVIEELVLYCFLGIFIIFVIDTFTHAAGAGGGISRGGGGGMFGGMSRRGSQTQYYRR